MEARVRAFILVNRIFEIKRLGSLPLDLTVKILVIIGSGGSIGFGIWHFRCERCLLTSAALMPLIRLLFFSLSVDDSTIKRLLKDSLIRKCMLSVVRGIANFGLRYPQPTGAPITRARRKMFICHK